MQKEIADKLVAALRSGNYKQGRCHLRNIEDEYCCLGVACEVAGILPTKVDDRSYTYGENSNCLLSDEFILTATTIKTSFGSFMPDEELIKKINTTKFFRDCSGKTSLASLNDIGMSFKEIADVIEKNWEQL